MFRLSNKAIQVVFDDSTEIILTSGAKAVIYTDKTGQRRAYMLAALPNDQDLLKCVASVAALCCGSPCSSSTASYCRRLRYTKEVLYCLINRGGSSK